MISCRIVRSDRPVGRPTVVDDQLEICPLGLYRDTHPCCSALIRDNNDNVNNSIDGPDILSCVTRRRIGLTRYWIVMLQAIELAVACYLAIGLH